MVFESVFHIWDEFLYLGVVGWPSGGEGRGSMERAPPAAACGNRAGSSSVEAHAEEVWTLSVLPKSWDKLSVLRSNRLKFIAYPDPIAYG